MPKLQITLPSGESSVRELSEDIITVGRVQDNDLALDDISVSSRHAELSLQNGDYQLKDLGSTNGTKVNGEKGTDWELQDGDVIIFGKVRAVYTSDIPSTKRSLPESDKVTAQLGSQSQRPSDFTNASRFKTKTKKKSPAATGIVAYFALSVLTFLAALALVFSIQPPA